MRIPSYPLMRHVATCRGEGEGYLAFSARFAERDLTASASLQDGTRVPCDLMPVDLPADREAVDPNAAAVWIARIPLVTLDVQVEVSQKGVPLALAQFPAMASKVSSRMLTTMRPQVAAVLRGYEHRHAAGGCDIRIDEGWPTEDGMVSWRVQVSYPTQDAEALPRLQAFDTQARYLMARTIVMEDHVVPSERDASRAERLVTFACLLPESVVSFFVEASLGGRPVGFAGMNAPRAQGLVGIARTHAHGAAACLAYERWFDEHRATAAELAWQRGAWESLDQDARPLLSIVMPVYRPNRIFLEAALASVLSQSYGNWELVVVNASGECEDVNDVLAGVDDPRVVALEVPNQSISQNTNAGIEAAQGDYVGFLDHDDMLEPDALWRYAQAIATHPDADLLYCDEDKLDGLHVHAPAFKTFPNLGRLYTHNYVTHFLMVSRRVLNLTERSDAEVSGAQDYDLTLKAFEVAREVVHVPHVLYHWREHESSTAGGEAQKPYAHEAGRVALAAHLKRRGIKGEVEDGPLTYTYRVRFAVPDPAPLVSIVIPTRDHGDLLRACVESILQRSTYPSFEVVLVENGSVEQSTFGLYEELAADERVRVVSWEAPEPGAFNYSAVVNHGVRHAAGDYVVLLNNDTEVIEPAWMEEMLGCLMRPEVGVVGAKLLFEDGLIQHVGMVAHPDGSFGHVCQNLSRNELGPNYAAAMPGDYAMVTGACQMVSRALYDELGGYDEGLAVGFNDGDFCLRAREAGHAVTVASHAVLYHREFSTRGRESRDARLKARYLQERSRMVARHPELFATGDPAVNPNLDPYGGYFELPA